MKRMCWLGIMWLMALTGQAQELVGRVTHQNKPLPGAHVQLVGTEWHTVSASDGRFRLSAAAGSHQLKISYLGFQNFFTTIQLQAGQRLELDFEMMADVLGLEQVVISANREATDRREAPVRVDVMNQQQMQRLQAVALTEGLSFNAGVRTENNCQNCGFTSVRLNGLPGAYTQILLDGRPVFSALNGVYGLDHIPTAMIGRVEVVRGGGSVLYGGNAVAGTVNIITREPYDNGFSIWQQSGLIQGRTPENTTQFNVDLVDAQQRAGITFYGMVRNRGWHDVTGDGFSDITQLNGQSLGANAFVKFNKRWQLKTHLYSLNEFRRGGNGFDLEPHQTDLAEQLRHRVWGARNDLSWYSADYRHRLTFYNATQFTQRHSYYGGGGRVLQPGDTLNNDDLMAINAYGQAVDRSSVSGMSWQFYQGAHWLITAGTEYWLNRVEDRMPGYQRLLDQRYQVWGNFVQAEYHVNERWKLMGGLRYDQVWLNGRYDLAADEFVQNRVFPMLLPRFSSLYRLSNEQRLRFSYAQGYRAPQAFDEDLHIELVGGAARFVRLSENLVPERSNSLSAAWEWERNKGKTAYQTAVEPFFTQLDQPFLLLEAEVLPNGTQILNKVNGSGARVYGVNLTQQLAFQRGGQLQAGFTWQRAPLVEAEVLWSDEATGEEVTTEQLLRTPDWYGFVSWRQPFARHYAVQSNAQLTGPMWLAHVTDPETAFTELKRSGSFVDLSIFVERQWILAERLRLETSIGIQNLLNSFQRDLDTGAERDASYIYGPIRPRTFLVSLRLVR